MSKKKKHSASPLTLNPVPRVSSLGPGSTDIHHQGGVRWRRRHIRLPERQKETGRGGAAQSGGPDPTRVGGVGRGRAQALPTQTQEVSHT